MSEIEEEIIYGEEAEFIAVTKEECEALLRECKYSWISYENPVARSLISRMMKFVDE